MTTSVQSASSNPSARDLLNLLHSMELEDPTSLDKPVFYWDGDYGWTEWVGVLETDIDEEGNQGIGISYNCSDAVKVKTARQLELAREAQAAEEALRPERVDHDERVRAAREQDLLPPGA
jgi:hypothetical protein